MKKLILRTLLLFVVLTHSSLFAAPTPSERDLTSFFGDYSGAFVLFDASQNHWVRFDPEQCRKRFSPWSTFKILNSLIALETRVADGAEFKIRWDGTQYPIKDWNHDQTLRSAFSASCVWYYRALAQRIDNAAMRDYVQKVGYGNSDISGGLTQFWLGSTLKISPDEQVNFLYRLHTHQLPFSLKTVNTVLDIMTLSKKGGVVYRGKTGTASRNAAGWFVGSAVKGSNQYYFATHLIGGDRPSGPTARKITEAILRGMGILPRN